MKNSFNSRLNSSLVAASLLTGSTLAHAEDTPKEPTKVEKVAEEYKYKINVALSAMFETEAMNTGRGLNGLLTTSYLPKLVDSQYVDSPTLKVNLVGQKGINFNQEVILTEGLTLGRKYWLSANATVGAGSATYLSGLDKKTSKDFHFSPIFSGMGTLKASIPFGTEQNKIYIAGFGGVNFLPVKVRIEPETFDRERAEVVTGGEVGVTDGTWSIGTRGTYYFTDKTTKDGGVGMNANGYISRTF